MKTTFLDQTIAPLGMGCWPIGGSMYAGEQSMGYANTDDATSVRTIHAALDCGILLFDTAAAYGAGNSEKLLGRALKNRTDALVVTKIGIGIDEATKQISFGTFLPEDVAPAIEGSLRRLQRDQIDLVLLHINEMAVVEASSIFDALDEAKRDGKIGAYGWSTDFSQSAASVAPRANFMAVEHAMNVFFEAPLMQAEIERKDLHALIRSPLAMGLLSGKYTETTELPEADIRSAQASWMEYYKDGRANAALLAKMDLVRDLLTADGRTLVQGALGWIWAKRPSNIPIPGARTPDQIKGIAEALSFGPLPADVVTEIDALIDRPNNEPERPR